MYEEHRWGYDQPMPIYYPPPMYYKPQKRYSIWMFFFDIFMVCLTWGWWLIWIFCREMRKR